MNHILAVAVAQEFCMPAYDQKGDTVVAFFKRPQDGARPQMQFCVPTPENETTALAMRFQELFVLAIQRYEEMTTGRLQIPSAVPDVKGNAAVTQKAEE